MKFSSQKVHRCRNCAKGYHTSCSRRISCKCACNKHPLARDQHKKPSLFGILAILEAVPEHQIPVQIAKKRCVLVQQAAFYYYLHLAAKYDLINIDQSESNQVGRNPNFCSLSESGKKVFESLEKLYLDMFKKHQN